jgi:hypothetical protein
MLLKPLSAAIAIGTGGPFGGRGSDHRDRGRARVEVGQLLHITRRQREDAARGRRRGRHGRDVRQPGPAVLLAIELLLFEYGRARSSRWRSRGSPRPASASLLVGPRPRSACRRRQPTDVALAAVRRARRGQGVVGA